MNVGLLKSFYWTQSHKVYVDFNWHTQAGKTENAHKGTEETKNRTYSE